jgi:hypothetical protein
VLVANNPAECLEMVDTRVPELNKTVIYFLLGFLQEMSRHAGVTRMGSANLGMARLPPPLPPPLRIRLTSACAVVRVRVRWCVCG